MLDRWFKKEKPMFTMLGMGGGNASRLIGGSAPIDASGGTKYTPGNGYIYHVFQHPNSDAFTVNSGQGDINYLLVGGGGAGGFANGNGAGGGGAGQVLSLTASGFGAGTYPVTVGAGGVSFRQPPVGAPAPPITEGTDGGDTEFNGARAGGGGLGASVWSPTLTPPAFFKIASNGRPGSPGGSGSGGGCGGGSNAVGTGSPPGGNPGGGNTHGGGGGGAGGAGSGPAYQNGAQGGAGLAVPIFPGPLFTSMPSPWQSAVGPTGLFGGGGGASGFGGESPNVSGGPGGGGPGQPSPDSSGSPAVDGTGGGGGGGSAMTQDPQATTYGGAGGKGICIIRYEAG